MPRGSRAGAPGSGRRRVPVPLSVGLRLAARCWTLLLAACALESLPAQADGGGGAASATPAAGSAVPAPAEARPRAPSQLSVAVLDDGALAKGWTDLGWASHVLSPGHPAQVDFSGFAGWIFARVETKAIDGGLVIRLRAPKAYLDFLEVSLAARAAQSFPAVRTRAEQRAELPEGWLEYWVSMQELNPEHLPFDRLVLRAAAPVGERTVEIARIGFTAAAPPTAQALAAARAPGRVAAVTLECGKVHAINPLIYGLAYGDPAVAGEMGASARRWGGNNSTLYNWKLNAWNPGNDWFFRNVTGSLADTGWSAYLKIDRERGLKTAVTVPTLGWVARDADTCSFPREQYPAQNRFDPYKPECGNGDSTEGEPLAPGPPERTSIPAPPAFVEEWVRALREADGPGPRSITHYLLDNEPTLWNVTHRDAHPEPVGYDELLQRTIDYASAVRRADPAARIAGFTAWGWPALFDSAKDKGPGGKRLLPRDRLMHGGKALLPWWLFKLQQYEQRTGERLVDTVDVHYYPQGDGIGIGPGGKTDPDTAARRIRSVRALWDPAYKDESWIAEPVKLVPRLRKWIDEEYPGLGISIGEYNFGAEQHISGGLALAEALGRFGTLGIESAYYWTAPARGSMAYWAFRAFRNYDGKGGRFGDESVTVTGGETYTSSVFASRTSDGRLVVVALNLEPDKALLLGVDPGTCGPAALASTWSLSDARGLVEGKVAPAAERIRLPPWSLVVLELRPAR